MDKYGFQVMHPSIEPKYNINTIIHPNYETEFRITNWTEISSLFMTHEYLNQVVHLFDTNKSGWGLPQLFLKETNINFIIYDSISVQDGRPLNKGLEPLYENTDVAYKEAALALTNIPFEPAKVLGFKLKNILSFPIIFDKEKAVYLEDCIKSIPEGSEIILMETIQSDDNQGIEEIQKNGNNIYAKYYYGKWDYAAARNAAKSLATRPIIFSIDSDERLLNDQHTAILKAALDLYKSDFAGLKVRNISVAKNPANTSAYILDACEQVRIFKNIPQIFWRFSIHENLEFSMKMANVEYADSLILIHHIGYDIEPIRLRDKHLGRLKMLLADTDCHKHPAYIQYIVNESANYNFYEKLLTKGSN
jgi:hypothetical protein